ncbi:MAG TPA: protein translocase subunit SecD [Candidatus Paceibacterota bacterium]|jgi:protein-export membrane protein, SecD/SecF family/protein-export membrane protein SecD
MWKQRISALLLLVIAFGIGYFAYDKAGTNASDSVTPSRFPYRLGLDLSGGTHLVFRADTASLPESEVSEAMQSLAQAVERRVNVLGVSEPLVQVEEGGTVGTTEHRLIVELPGITDVKQAVDAIGKTPTLDFRLMKPGSENLTPEEQEKATFDDVFVTTGLTGRYLKRATLQFNPTTYAPEVGLQWNDEGAKLFAQITRDNVGKPLAIFLDGAPISIPRIQTEITSGEAVINGTFKVEEAKALVRDLNYGALPVPVSLASTQTVGATLGQGALNASVHAGLIAFIAVAIFLIIWYRVPGLVATIALAIYVALNLALFKLVPVTLTAAGIAGFVLTLGMAVDANILIFERMKEEIARGKKLPEAIKEGFHRAWLSIRDSNLSSIITAIILYYFASTPIVKGFALVFGLGVVVSMFTAITASRTLLIAVAPRGERALSRFLFGSGFIPKKSSR